MTAVNLTKDRRRCFRHRFESWLCARVFFFLERALAIFVRVFDSGVLFGNQRIIINRRTCSTRVDTLMSVTIYGSNDKHKTPPNVLHARAKVLLHKSEPRRTTQNSQIYPRRPIFLFFFLFFHCRRRNVPLRPGKKYANGRRRRGGTRICWKNKSILRDRTAKSEINE